MAWDSYSLSATLPAGADVSDFQTSLLKHLSTLGSLGKAVVRPDGLQLTFRPRGSILRAKALLQTTQNGRTGESVVRITGKSGMSFGWFVLSMTALIGTMGFMFPVLLLGLLFTYKKPREALDDALKASVATV